jgi:hypothetical protein
MRIYCNNITQRNSGTPEIENLDKYTTSHPPPKLLAATQLSNIRPKEGCESEARTSSGGSDFCNNVNVRMRHGNQLTPPLDAKNSAKIGSGICFMKQRDTLLYICLIEDSV